MHCIKYIAYLSSPNKSGLFSQVNEFHKSFSEVHCTLSMSTACVRFDMLFDPVFVATILLGVYFQMFS